MSFFETFWQGVLATGFLEWVAVLAGLGYVIFAAYRSMLCWFLAFVSASLYVYLCYVNKLYIESLLQLFYVVMAIVGWWSWSKARQSAQQEIRIQVWKFWKHAINIVVSGIVAVILGWLFQTYTDQENPYLDAFTTVYSLVATFLVTRRVLENWIYWVVIDAVSIGLYTSRELYLSSILFLLYTVLAIVGLFAWWRQLKLQES
jgi:nicotinamide mononucleotide transporter